MPLKNFKLPLVHETVKAQRFDHKLFVVITIDLQNETVIQILSMILRKESNYT